MKPVEYKTVPITAVHEDPRNARLHNAKNLAGIRGSLRKFGQVEVLVCQKSTMKVIGGNGRLVVMRELKFQQVDIALVDVTDQEATALGIALNRTSDTSTFDAERLDQLLQEFTTDDDDLQGMFGDLAEELGILMADNDETQIEEVRVKPPPTMVWLLIGVELSKFGSVRDHIVALQKSAAVQVQSNRDVQDGR